ncbi:hypothetical protein [Olivibacter sp. XZL3]|uniref:hypothetical protein n=1 Tax=Olivibacter sp. XZL3 TaxID=1735116 RepID=UPI0010648B81|nr:hypothetical protein [Olivibacter sp. XZL3]
MKKTRRHVFPILIGMLLLCGCGTAKSTITQKDTATQLFHILLELEEHHEISLLRKALLFPEVIAIQVFPCPAYIRPDNTPRATMVNITLRDKSVFPAFQERLSKTTIKIRSLAIGIAE